MISTLENSEHKNTATTREFTIKLDSFAREKTRRRNYVERRGSALLIATILSLSCSMLILTPARCTPAQAGTDKSVQVPVQVQVPALAPALAPAADESSPESGAKRPIEGKIEHAESMPVIEDQFKPGTKFDESKLSKLTPDNIWIPAPDWFAGKWHSDTQTTTYVYNFESGVASPQQDVIKAAGDITFGTQQSKDGQIWQFVKIPRLEKKELEDGTADLYAVREDMLAYTASKLVLKYSYYEIQVDSEGVIDSVDRVSSINTYTPLDDGLVRVKASLKSFAEDGKPKTLQLTEKALRRVAPYKQIDAQDGLDLKQLFVEFLKKSGKADQIPPA